MKFGPFVHGDLINRNEIDEVFKKYSPVAVMHFAAMSQVGESVREPALYWENNVLGSLNLIQSAVDHGCQNVIFSSTCATYGEQDKIVLDEDSLQLPVNAYGASKLAVENMLNNFLASFGLRHVIFRYFNVAGADPSAVIGEFHKPETHLIPLILDAAIGVSGPVTIFGTDYDTPDGTCIRDYVHVSDLAEAHILGLKWLLNGKASRAFNLGTSNGFSVREVIDHARLVTNRYIPFVEGDRRPGDCAKLVSGSSRANIELGWSANRSNLLEMITDAWRWHQTGGFN